MNRAFSYLIFIMLVVCGCNQSAGNHDSNRAADTSSAQKNTVPKDSIIKNPDTINPIQAIFPGSDTLFAKMHIDGVKDLKTLPVKIESGKILYAKVIPAQTKANLRINQVQMPDSSLDGPFGRDLDYKIKIPGIYKLIIGESMMAEGNWKGDFTVKIWVK